VRAGSPAHPELPSGPQAPGRIDNKDECRSRSGNIYTSVTILQMTGVPWQK